IGINRKWLDFGPAYEVVARQVANFEVVNGVIRPVEAGVLADTSEIPNVIVVGRSRAERVVPHYLGAGVGIVRIDKWKRFASNVADQAFAVGAESHLRGVFLRRLAIGWRPLDTPSRRDLHRHAAQHSQVHSWRDQTSYLGGVLGGNEVAGFQLRESRGRSEHDKHERPEQY